MPGSCWLLLFYFLFFFPLLKEPKPLILPINFHPSVLLTGRGRKCGFWSGLLRKQDETQHTPVSAPFLTTLASNFNHTSSLSPIIRRWHMRQSDSRFLAPQPPQEPHPLLAHQLLQGSELLGQVAEACVVQLQPAQAGHRLHMLWEVATLGGHEGERTALPVG